MADGQAETLHQIRLEDHKPSTVLIRSPKQGEFAPLHRRQTEYSRNSIAVERIHSRRIHYSPFFQNLKSQ